MSHVSAPLFGGANYSYRCSLNVSSLGWFWSSSRLCPTSPCVEIYLLPQVSNIVCSMPSASMISSIWNLYVNFCHVDYKMSPDRFRFLSDILILFIMSIIYPYRWWLTQNILSKNQIISMWQIRHLSMLMLGLHPAIERRRYKVTPSLIGWAQT